MSNMPESQRRPASLAKLQWNSANIEASLGEVFEFVSSLAKESIDWYGRRKQPQKRMAQLIRATAVLATAIAGVAPIVSQILETPSGRFPLSPAWASVLLAVAAAAMALDRYFGFSTTWTRFTTAQLRLEGRFQEFRLEWVAQRSAWAGQTPTQEQAQAAISRVSAFTSEVSGVVQEETRAWVEEFQQRLSELDQALKAERERRQPGALEVNVENGDEVDAWWVLHIEGKGDTQHRGKSGAVSGVDPGMHTVTVKGSIRGKDVAAEAVADVTPGQVTNIAVTLS